MNVFKSFKYIILAISAAFIGCEQTTQTNVEQPDDLPRIWMSYKPYHGFDQDFKLLTENGVGAVSVNQASAEALQAARKHDMKIIMKIEDMTERAYDFPQDKVERAVMLAGAYQGKAIDRFRFAFTAEPQEIIIENPVYDSINCYGDGLGHYFPGMQDPLKAEVIVKQADFDGEPHLQIIPATTSRMDDHHWRMKFDLTGVSGDLENVLLAVYWISKGSREYWMFGDSASPFAASTREAVARETKKVIDEWSQANGGTFPKDVITIARYGDECWNVTGHLNCSACSYPIWDYSEAAIKDYDKDFPGQIHPRGKSWPDMFGRQAYANWLYNYHQATASLVEAVKEALTESGLNLPLYRNFTRAQVFDVQNDHDGSGLELLTEAFDITLIDPYPVSPNGYLEDIIPVDMNYIAGMARRYDKMLVPWMQAHHYLPEQGYLDHPSASDVEKIIRQQKMFNPEAAMWLGYGEGDFYTFPETRPDAWQKAMEIQMQLFENQQAIEAELAVLRPYNVRGLREKDDRQMQDKVFTSFLKHISTDTLIYYDAFEPLNLQNLAEDDLQSYPIILAEAGDLSADELGALLQMNKKTLVYIQEADKFEIDSDLTGIKNYVEKVNQTLQQDEITLSGIDHYELTNKAEMLVEIDGYPVAWKVDNAYFITGIPAGNPRDYFQLWIDLMES